MITIHILNFSLVRDALGQKYMDIDIPKGETVRYLLNTIKAMNKQRLLNLPIRVAVNQSYVDDNYKLCNDDIVALIPPVSGG